MSYIGSTFSCLASTPATEDQSGYEALSLTEVGNVVSHSPIGDVYEDQAVTLLKTGRTKHSNGAADGGTITVTIDGEDFTDAGMVILEAGEGTNTAHTFAFATNDQTYYMQGIVQGIRTLEATSSQRAGLEVTLAINTGLTRVAAA